MVLMVVDHRQHHLDSLRSALAFVLYPVQQLTSLPRTGGEWLAEGFASRRELQEENASLKAQQLLLNAQLQKLDALQAENMRLRGLLESSIRVGEKVLIAEILSVDLNPFNRQIVINKGSRHNVYPGQPLLDAQGVMGQVVSVSPLTSIAMIISDPSHAIPVTVNRNGLRAIAIGTGTSNALDLPHIPNNADIQVGDLLITSGLGGRFPPNYPVGTVTEVSINPSEPFAHVRAEPTAKLDRSREVLLVWHKDPARTAEMECPEGQADCAAPAGGEH